MLADSLLLSRVTRTDPAWFSQILTEVNFSPDKNQLEKYFIVQIHYIFLELNINFPFLFKINMKSK